jgi:large subunit ribosomal protein L25
MSDIVQVQKRDKKEEGSRACRRMREEGLIPAVLYGHKEACVNLKVKVVDIVTAVRLGHKLLDLKGAISEKALLKSVQWDSLGTDIIHVDLARVSETERVRTKVAVELKGDAPGAREGGMVKHILHEIEIECPAASSPERIIAWVKDLHVGGEIFARDLTLPEGVKIAGHDDVVVATCAKVVVSAEEAVATPGAAEPELIRKEKPADEAAE